MSRDLLVPEGSARSIEWYLDAAADSFDNLYVELSDDKRTLTYKSGRPGVKRRDYWTVRSNTSFTTGVHYVVIHVHKIGDEGNFGIINDPDVVGDGQNLWRPSGVHYYCGRRHKCGDMNDGCASLKIDGTPVKRMFHIADGVDVGLLINCDTRRIDFYLNDMLQGSAEMPPGPVWVTSMPDWTEDRFEITEKPLPYQPFALVSWFTWLRKACFSSDVHTGDIVKVNGRWGNVLYGPDLQGDAQLIFSDVYPDLFGVSGDMNVNNPDVKTDRHFTSLAILGAFFSSVLSLVFLAFSIKVAWGAHDRLTLEDHVPFKCCIVGFLFTLTIAVLLALMKVPEASVKKKLLRTLQFVPTTLGALAILIWGAEEADLSCAEEHWGPMIPAITELYAPHGVDRDDVSSWLLPLVLFNPLRAPPAVLLPSMEHSIAQPDLQERGVYFMSQVLMMVGITCLVLEVLRVVFTKCLPRLLGCKVAEPDIGRGLDTDGEPAQSTPLVTPSDPQKPAERRSWLPGIVRMCMFMLWYVGFQVLLHIEMDVMVMIGAVNLRTGPAWEFWIIFIFYVCATHLITGIVRYIRDFGVEQKAATPMVLTTLAPVLGNEIHIFKDHVETALCFAICHCRDGELRLVALVLGSLSFVATFGPLAFLFSDRLAREGLVRAHWPLLEATTPEPASSYIPKPEARYSVDDLVMVSGEIENFDEDDAIEDMSLKDWGCQKLASIQHIYPLGTTAFVRLEDADGIVDDIPVADTQIHNLTFFTAPTIEGKMFALCERFRKGVLASLAQYVGRFVDVAVPAVTVEKEMRALLGECPSGVLDIVFIFFFGGSLFMIFAIAISVAKVLGIPVIREHILPWLIRRYGCSMSALTLYRANAPHIYLFGSEPDSNIFDAITKFQWSGFKDRLIAAGCDEAAESVDEALLAAARAGKGKALRDEFEALSQRTDHVLVGRIAEGSVEDVEALVKCGFDTRGLYSCEKVYRGRPVTLDAIVAEFFGTTDGKGQRQPNELGREMLSAIEKSR
eukprot:TRINITY_DN25261_c0_g1_i3.p1 TRINITY_DN25261_c0_g1~~TRINITY_DN25261_c0_g1_i3.p1  ORF type:complete len:1033 (+),score=121.73 TRINITY_DN25261_c0_g1_i3:52-3099(+)